MSANATLDHLRNLVRAASGGGGPTLNVTSLQSIHNGTQDMGPAESIRPDGLRNPECSSPEIIFRLVPIDEMCNATQDGGNI